MNDILGVRRFHLTEPLIRPQRSVGHSLTKTNMHGCHQTDHVWSESLVVGAARSSAPHSVGWPLEVRDGRNPLSFRYSIPKRGSEPVFP